MDVKIKKTNTRTCKTGKCGCRVKKPAVINDDTKPYNVSICVNSKKTYFVELPTDVDKTDLNAVTAFAAKSIATVLNNAKILKTISRPADNNLFVINFVIQRTTVEYSQKNVDDRWVLTDTTENKAIERSPRKGIADRNYLEGYLEGQLCERQKHQKPTILARTLLWFKLKLKSLKSYTTEKLAVRLRRNRKN